MKRYSTARIPTKWQRILSCNHNLISTTFSGVALIRGKCLLEAGADSDPSVNDAAFVYERVALVYESNIMPYFIL